MAVGRGLGDCVSDRILVPWHQDQNNSVSAVDGADGVDRKEGLEELAYDCVHSEPMETMHDGPRHY